MAKFDRELADAKLMEFRGQIGSREFTEEELAKARISIGSASRWYKPGWRFWNWLVDAEYTAIGPAPILWILVLGGIGALSVISTVWSLTHS